MVFWRKLLFYLFVIDHPAVSIFATRPMVLLGQASYSLYLIHQHIGVAIMRVFIAHGVPYLVILPITVVLIIGSAIALFHFWEEPAKRWMLVHSKRLTAALDRRLPWLSYSRT